MRIFCCRICKCHSIQPSKHFPSSSAATAFLKKEKKKRVHQIHWHLFLFACQTTSTSLHLHPGELIVTQAWKAAAHQFITSQLTHLLFSSLPFFPPASCTPVWFTMTTESGADSEAKQPQENTEKGKAKAAAATEPTSPQNQPEQLPAAAGHSTPARKEQVSLFMHNHMHSPSALQEQEL